MPKVDVTAYRDFLVITTHDPHVVTEAWTPDHLGGIGQVLLDTRDNLGVSDEALILIRSIKSINRRSGDLDWWRYKDADRYGFAWMGGCFRVFHAIGIRTGISHEVPTGHHIVIANEVPESARAVIDRKFRRMN